MKDIHNENNNQIIPKTKLRKPKKKKKIKRTEPKKIIRIEKKNNRIIITSNFRVVQSTKSEINV